MQEKKEPKLYFYDDEVHKPIKCKIQKKKKQVKRPSSTPVTSQYFSLYIGWRQSGQPIRAIPAGRKQKVMGRIREDTLKKP